MSDDTGTSPRQHSRHERRRLRVRGVVQGVGFRPFVYRLAQELDLSGWVRNDGGGVEIEVQGSPGNLSALAARLRGEAPPLARIDHLESELREFDPADRGFTITASRSGEVTTAIGHDSTVCPACLDEMFDPAGRRWRYPFINCTHCGPRYTLTRGLPYDRVNTSMAAFALCDDCADEYSAPTDRRFHAEPNACPVCGPRLTLLEGFGITVATRDPVADTLLRLLCGEIVAVKGLGGFHLMCDARNPEAVSRLRERKSRENKPFALMVANLESARHWAKLSGADEQLLASAERPVVLCDKRASVDSELWGVAPALSSVGLMLPYAPLHYLLFHDYAGRPAGTGWLDKALDLALVCTSANPGGEPLVTGNREATRRLMGIADAYLIHDRDIVVRCDDSVMRSLPATRYDDSGVQFIRRSRGYTPRALKLSCKGPAVLAFGGLLKNTLCLTRGDEAFLSQHIGDLESASACQALDEVAEHMQRILALSPQAVAHDLHPDFPSTRAAEALAERLGIPAFAIQHHHAHVAAVEAEHHHHVRCSAWRWTVSASAPTAMPGAANCCGWKVRASSVSATSPRCRCPAPTRPRANPGAWPRRCSTASAAATRSPAASTTSRPPGAWLICSPPAPAAHRPPASAAGSTPPPACSASAAGWATKARRRCGWKASPPGSARCCRCPAAGASPKAGPTAARWTCCRCSPPWPTRPTPHAARRCSTPRWRPRSKPGPCARPTLPACTPWRCPAAVSSTA